MSGGSFNTAQALLKAGNFESARRIVRKALDENPNNLRAWELRIEIETQAGEHKEALKLVRQVLTDHPDSAPLRKAEFSALMSLGKRREGKKTRDRFKEDFPFLTNYIEMMNLQLDAHSGNTKKVAGKLQEYGEHTYGAESLKNLGIAHHRIDDIFRAKRMMNESHAEFPNDPELNAAIATNYFQLARPGTARKYARLALAADPANRRMSLLIKASWLMYFPPFFCLTFILKLIYGFDSLVGRIGSYLLMIPIILLSIDFFNITFSALIVLTGFDWNGLDTVLWISWLGLQITVTVPGIYKKIFERKKSVTLKKY